eukprot:CFRG8083T1
MVEATVTKEKRSRKGGMSLSRPVVDPEGADVDASVVQESTLIKKPKRTLDNTSADDDEKRLEALLFSDMHETELDGALVSREAMRGDSEDEDEPIDFSNMDFIIDRSGSKNLSENTATEAVTDDTPEKNIVEDVTSDSSKDNVRGEKRSAWVDDDDKIVEVSFASHSRTRKLRKTEDDNVVNGVEYGDRLRSQFTRTFGSKQQAWADHVEEDVDGNSLMAWSGSILSKDGVNVSLPKSMLDVTRVTDANKQEYSKSAIQCIKFHPNAAVAIVGGMDKTLRLFSIDGKTNAKVQSIFLRDLPIQSCEFSADGSQIYLSGRRPFFYSYNIHTGVVDKVHRLHGRSEKSLESMFVSPSGKLLVFLGNSGSLLLVDARTKRLVDTLKMNGSSRAVTFSPDGSKMYSFGSSGEVYVWNMNSRKCVHKFRDEGCVSGVQITMSKDGNYLATGCESGVVNIYDATTLSASAIPKPIKTIMNITTRADTLLFNHDSSILAIATKQKKDTLKLVHMQSLSVFSNWPTAATPLRFVHALTFSPNSGYLAVGNDRGHVLLYRLNHYQSS